MDGKRLLQNKKDYRIVHFYHENYLVAGTRAFYLCSNIRSVRMG
jgi:hypothetical protein